MLHPLSIKLKQSLSGEKEKNFKNKTEQNKKTKPVEENFFP